MNSNNTNITTAAKRILVLEDDTFLRNILGSKLNTKGFIVDSVENVAAAKQALSQEKYDLIITDLLLPNENGASFLKEIKASESNYKNIPVFVLSNLYEGEQVEEVKKKLGVTEFMVKSNIAPHEIIERVLNIFSN